MRAAMRPSDAGAAAPPMGRCAFRAATSTGSNSQPRGVRTGCSNWPSILRIGKMLRYPSSAATWARVSQPAWGEVALSGCFGSGVGVVSADSGASSVLIGIASARLVRHGVYRLVHFPAGDHEELEVVWPWSERKGVFS